MKNENVLAQDDGGGPSLLMRNSRRAGPSPPPTKNDLSIWIGVTLFHTLIDFSIGLYGQSHP